MPLLCGTRLGPYEILDLIGSGGMGEVYRARDAHLDRDVAIKVLPNFSSDSDRLRRFEQEARATAALSHPNIVAVFQLGTYEGAPYLVSELLDGETLREQIRRSGHLSIRKTTDYGVQIARGLAAAHDKGIVHRDLKPENLFVVRDGRIKILDFGLAKLTQRRDVSDLAGATQVETQSTEPGTIMGTAGYMSPEQVRGQATDHRTDIFAFGAIVYEMLTGKRAFQKATSAETMTAILNDEPPEISQLAPDLPPAFARIVRRCLEKNPDRRFQSASDLAFALEALSDSGTGSAASPTQDGARSIWQWIAASVAVLAIVATIATWRGTSNAAPSVKAVLQLTDDGEPKNRHLVTDGSRIYFNEGAPGSWRIAQVSVNGGQTAPVTTRLVNPQITALSPDGSSLLALVGGFNDPVYPLWSIPLPAGEPRPVGEIQAQDAAFFPDGRIVFTRGRGLFVVEKDGSNPRKLSEFKNYVIGQHVSPNGAAISVTMWSGVLTTSRLLEISVDNPTAQHEIVHVNSEITSPGHGVWTPNARYLLFEDSGIRSDLWALRQRSGFLQKPPPPVRLTNGPLAYTGAIPGRDANHVFAVGSKHRSELIRYDEKIHQFVSVYPGLSVTDAGFSRDGQWVVYRMYPDCTLWRSRADGSDRLQLTYLPTLVWLPAISPDGTKVSYGTSERVVYVAGVNGGMPRKVADESITGSFSPDSNHLAITSFVPGKTSGDNLAVRLKTLDLQTGELTAVPDSDGFLGAFWLDDHTLIAATQDTSKFQLFDLTTHKAAVLATGNFVNWIPSKDLKYLYFTTGGEDPKAQRLRLSDRKIETIVDLQDVRRVIDPYFGTQIGLTPDGSVLLARDVGTQEIYSLEINWP
jgi:serine/threonine protein kinase